MNHLIELKGHFTSFSPSNRQRGGPVIPKGQQVNVDDLRQLKNDLENVYIFWQEDSYLEDALVDVRYRQVIAKSNRMGELIKEPGIPTNNSVVGSEYSEFNDKPCHLITYRFSLKGIRESLQDIENSLRIMTDYFEGVITHEDMYKINRFRINFATYNGMSKTKFLQIIKDAYYVVRLEVPSQILEEEAQIVTFYDIGIDIRTVLNKLNINLLDSRMMDSQTFLLDRTQVMILNNYAPYLISMAVKDFSEYELGDIVSNMDEIDGTLNIPLPSNEPTIGVIDTLFDEEVYFSEWVEYHNYLDSDLGQSNNASYHGTAVSSIIVDGPTINPNLDDGCGRFRVRHFGVAGEGRSSSFTIIKKIERIIIENPDIKVWNFCLGSPYEIKENSISPEGYVLDRLQKEHDILFVVSGTNDSDYTGRKRIGSPADSLNSLVVNSVNDSGASASYTRTGPVLSFFNKPDISYYGGDNNQLIRVCTPTGEAYVSGTSYAAPWITRKAAYLIHIMGFSREITKALLIDAAIPWEGELGDISKKGYGVVPIKIEDVIQGRDDEIKFYVSSRAESQKTYNYNIPVPTEQDMYPYVARATMCYFTDCTRNQGVDYTDTELDLKFGRIHDKGHIASINDDKQFIPENYTYEEEAREKFRKWDNVKHIREKYTNRKRDKKSYLNPNWGLEVVRSTRLSNTPTDIDFGVVVTLKEINGVNRVDSFVQKCSLQGWIVRRIEIEQQVDIYNIAQEEIEFDV